MAKLQLINTYMTERLSAAVREIVEVVEGALVEFQEENESLRRKLRELGLQEGACMGDVQLLSLPGPDARSPSEQDRSMCPTPGTQVQPSDAKPELYVVDSDDLYRPARPGYEELTSDQAGLTLVRRGLKPDQDSEDLADLFKIQVVCGVEDRQPIKSEPSAESSVSVGREQPHRGADEGFSHVAAKLSAQPEMGQLGGRYGEVSAKRAHVCPQCGKAFSHVSRLKIHLRIHTGEKPYRCLQCGKCFNNDGTLKNHQRVHMQLRLYSCPQCGMSFKDAYTCKKHQRVHMGDRASCCSLCGRHFSDAASLQSHIRTHAEGERPHSCALCGKRFIDPGKLTRHLRTHSRQELS